MIKIIHDAQNLIIDVRFDKRTESVKWSINSNDGFTPTFTTTQIKTLIETLQKSLDFEWNPKT